MEWMLLPLKRYAQFSGRSRRQEYWMFILFQFLLYTVLGVVGMVIGAGAAGLSSAGGNPSGAGLMGMFAAFGIFALVFMIVYFALLIPSIAVTVRRLHDQERSGMWLLAVIVPYVIGYIVAIAGAAAESTVIAGLGGLVTLLGVIAGLVLFVFMFLPGTPGPNRYGPDPKAGEHAVAAPPAY